MYLCFLSYEILLSEVILDNLWLIVNRVKRWLTCSFFPGSSVITSLTYAFTQIKIWHFLNTKSQFFVGGAILCLMLTFWKMLWTSLQNIIIFYGA